MHLFIQEISLNYYSFPSPGLRSKHTRRRKLAGIPYSLKFLYQWWDRVNKETDVKYLVLANAVTKIKKFKDLVGGLGTEKF